MSAFLAATGADPVTRADVETFLARPRRDGTARAASTKRAELMALRAFFAFVEGDVVDAAAEIRIKRERRPDPAVAMPSEIGPLFEAAARSPMPARNVLLVAIFAVLGLRVHELAFLDATQVDVSAGVLRRVRGKGGTVTDFPLPRALVALARAWLTERTMLGYADGPLFPTARPGSSTTGRLSVRSVQRLVGRLAEDAGLDRRLGPHALRHGCATAAISLGIDVPTTAEVMRHASIATTQTYVHLAHDARRGALERIASLIPPAVVPVGRGHGVQNPTGTAGHAGDLAAVDFHPPMDARQAGRDDAAGVAA